MIAFLGEYEATVDAKGRFLLPAGFKKQLAEGEVRFVLNRGFENCLTLYPLQSWAPVFEKVNSLNEFDPKVRAFRRQFLGGATEVELDSAGRLLLPANLKEFAGLEKDIILVAATNKIEIWNATTYKNLFTAISPEAFSELAMEVMGTLQKP
ncbi:MAG: division/cell wall cluster transcriptional repressor MraZ [Bacteroidetes bacterium]|nr:MAG: division/cell wall cluster transcriptional repressor MraZ [Bacteroidota bacterium]TAF93783.1 MAG: division/cell wall cluster transcriptional repressor MraZ [Bacteroidota bacterium]